VLDKLAGAPRIGELGLARAPVLSRVGREH
jgi:hypothetical protein